MFTLKFKSGIYGKSDLRENVEGVRIMSEPWEVDGVELIALTVDYVDSPSEELTAVQNNYRLE